VIQDLRLEVNDVLFFPRSNIGDWNAFLATKLTPTLQFILLPMRGAVDALILRDLLSD
jgi:hypothetical protein